MRIGIVCPYTWDVPGGVQQHIRDLAEALIGLGHEVSVISPADDDTPLPDYVVPAEGSRRDKIAAMTQQMARDFEAGIAAHPEDWHMLQRVFGEDFDPARLPAATGPGEELNAGIGGDGAGGGGPS